MKTQEEIALYGINSEIELLEFRIAHSGTCIKTLEAARKEGVGPGATDALNKLLELYIEAKAGAEGRLGTAQVFLQILSMSDK